MKKTAITLTLLMILISGCGSKNADSRITLQEGVASDTIGDNIVTKPVIHAFNALTGRRIDITKAVTRETDAGFMELFVTGYNNSYDTIRFQYKVEWLDEDGLPITSKTSTWLPMSVTGRSTFTIRDVASKLNAVDFTMNTRDKE